MVTSISNHPINYIVLRLENYRNRKIKWGQFLKMDIYKCPKMKNDRKVFAKSEFTAYCCKTEKNPKSFAA
jgi:hypothetical protein